MVLAWAGLAACGRGGAPDTGWLTFAPAQIDVTLFEGDPTTVTVVATSTRTFDGLVQVGILDPDGVLTGAPSLSISGLQVTARLTVAPALAPGLHSGAFTIRVCQDAPTRCAQPLGGPWQLPYRVTVLADDRPPLAALPGAGPWRTVGGDAGHTGYVPARLDPARFSRRFSVPAYPWWVRTDTMGIAVEGGRLYYVKGDYHWDVTAFAEEDGHAQWKHDLGTLHWFGQPAVGHGHVYVASSDGDTDTALWVLDQETGAQLRRLGMDSQFDRFGAPEIAGDDVYVQDGHYGGLSRFDGTQLTKAWSNREAPWHMDPYTSLADGAFVYLEDGVNLQALNAANGTEAFRIPIASARGLPPGAPGVAPVLGSNGGVYHVFYNAQDGRLERFDVVQRTNPWERTGNYNSQPAVANGVVYIVNGDVLEALREDTGERLWAFTIPGVPPGQDLTTGRIPHQEVVVVGHHAFVTTSTSLYAVDVDTHEQVWSHPVTGRLAVSENGVLHVLTWDGRLVAINLQ